MNDLQESNVYLSDLDRIVVSIFNAEPVSAQPKYIVDLGGGDGRVLRRISETVRQKSLRGSMLEQAPLRFVGLNGSHGNQQAVARHDIDRLSMPRPDDAYQGVIQTLLSSEIENPENALYVFSTLFGGAGAEPASGFAGETDFAVARSLLSGAQGWRRLFRKHGLIVAGFHAGPGAAPGGPSALPEADTFLMSMAHGGLLPESDSFHRYPKARTRAEQTLGLFKTRDYRIRLADQADMPMLVRLEEECWAPGLQMSPEILGRRLEVFREGQLVLEANGGVSAVVYSQRVRSADFTGLTAFDVHHLHQQDGPIVQLLAINVLPEAQYQSHGDQLLEFMLQYCSVIAGIDTVVGITRCKDYSKHAGVPMEQYIALRNERGRLVDTVLRFHEQHGAAIEQVVVGYRPPDVVNQGTGVLIKYDIHRRRRIEARLESSGGAGGTDEDIPRFVIGAVTLILQSGAPAEIEMTQPLFELGLDSADLLDLNERIGSRFGVILEPAFFFEHNTCERIIAHLYEVVRARVQSRGVVEDASGPDAPSASDVAESTTPANEGVTERAEYGSTGDRDEAVAVVGAACLLPGGIGNPEQLWKLLEEGRDAIGRLPPWRWTWPSNIDPEGQHRGIDIGGFADGIEKFDAGFFRISPREAAVMDPQQRILLQLTWACLEDAGQVPQSLAGSRTGVFVGASGSDYQLRLSEELRDEIDGHFGLATSMAILANRLSYFYDLTGPSIQLDGACSSSLMAVHEAVKSINTGQCSQALVAGINVMCHPANTVAYYKAGMLSPDGKCKTFDKAANGYVRGEGAIVMLLRPLPDAVRDGNRITES